MAAARRRAMSIHAPRARTSTAPAPIPAAPTSFMVLLLLSAACGPLRPLLARSLSFSVTAKIPASPAYGVFPAVPSTLTDSVSGNGLSP